MVTPPADVWRVGLCKEIIEVQKGSQLEIPGFSKEECDAILRYACVT